MTNTVVVAVYAPFAIITAIIFIANFFGRLNRQVFFLFRSLCLCLLFWFASRFIGITTDYVETAKFCLNLSVVFIGLMPPLLLMTILVFYRISLKKKYLLTVLMFIIPALNIVMALTTQHHTLMYRQLEIVSLAPIREVVFEWGAWFWVHTCYSYALAMITIATIIVMHFRIPKFYRTPSTLIIVSVLIVLAGNLVTLSQILPLTLDPTLIAMSLALFFFDMAIFSNSNSKFVRFSRRAVFQYINEYILILDETQRIVDYNNLALQWFSNQNITLSSALFSNVMAALLAKENVIKKELTTEDESDIYLNDGIFPMVLNLRVKKMLDARGEEIGSIAIFTDVTQNRLLIERLEAQAGMDSLTGLANRMAYEGAKDRLDSPSHYPMSVIVCDANKLKHVNDTLGHKYGDMLLQMIADVLAGLCPERCFVARLGGDEFIFLLPSTTPEKAAALMERIRDTLAGYKKTPFTLSVAMGAATKFVSTENLDQIISLADSRMYEDKKRRQMIVVAEPQQ